MSDHVLTCKTECFWKTLNEHIGFTVISYSSASIFLFRRSPIRSKPSDQRSTAHSDTRWRTPTLRTYHYCAVYIHQQRLSAPSSVARSAPSSSVLLLLLSSLVSSLESSLESSSAVAFTPPCGKKDMKDMSTFGSSAASAALRSSLMAIPMTTSTQF